MQKSDDGLGEHRVSTSLDSKELKLDAVPPFIVHDSYELSRRSGYLIYDFTLLRLSAKVQFSTYPNIRPICLPTNRFQDYDEKTAGVVAGWGFTRIRHIMIGDLMRGLGSFPSDTLQKLSVRFRDSIFGDYHLFCFISQDGGAGPVPGYLQRC